MMNRSILVGRLTRDPELRYTPAGVAVTNITIAVNRPFKNQSGENEADFINCVVWRKPAENVANYLNKGSLVGVDGRIQTSSYEKDDGTKVYKVEINAESVQFLESKGKSTQGKQNSAQGQNEPADDPFQGEGNEINIKDDDLPF